MVTLDDVLDALEEQLEATDRPIATAPEVAQHVDQTRRKTLDDLRLLERAGDVESHSVGANATVWWPTGDGADDGGEPTPETSPVAPAQTRDEPPAGGAESAEGHEAPRERAESEADPSAGGDERASDAPRERPADTASASDDAPARDVEAEEVWRALEEIDVTGRGHDTRQVRRKAIMRAWEELRERGTAETQEIALPAFDEYVDNPQFGYSENEDHHRAYNFWDSCAREVMKQLPYVKSPPPRGNTWTYTGDANNGADDGGEVYDPTSEF
jgi:hypothetical protein